MEPNQAEPQEEEAALLTTTVSMSSSNSVAQSQGDTMCHVCAVVPCKFHHFGAVVCHRCKSFFRRSVRRGRNGAPVVDRCLSTKQDYYDGIEPICDLSVYRGACQSCRLSACLRAGMRPEQVLTEEGRVCRFSRRRQSQAELELAVLDSRERAQFAGTRNPFATGCFEGRGACVRMGAEGREVISPRSVPEQQAGHFGCSSLVPGRWSGCSYNGSLAPQIPWTDKPEPFPSGKDSAKFYYEKPVVSPPWIVGEDCEEGTASRMTCKQ